MLTTIQATARPRHGAAAAPRSWREPGLRSGFGRARQQRGLLLGQEVLVLVRCLVASVVLGLPLAQVVCVLYQLTHRELSVFN